jgi:2,3-bisphosphoglycerate-dependent phosphoglycerate mutase
MNKVLYIVRHCQATGQEPDALLTSEGYVQAVALADLLAKAAIERIISSPFARAYQSVVPLAENLCLKIDTDERLVERVLSKSPLDNWREHLADTFTNLDLCMDGGESSRAAMDRVVSVMDEILQHDATTTAVVTHGNLMILLLKCLDDRIGFVEWESLKNPDVYRVEFKNDGVQIERIV